LAKKPFLLKLNGGKAVGKIEGIALGGGAFDEGISYYYQYQFVAENDSVLRHNRSYVLKGKKARSIGDSVNIIYYTPNASINSVNSFEELYLIPLSVFIFGLVWGFGGLVLNRHYKPAA
jgi:hypothetical protein